MSYVMPTANSNIAAVPEIVEIDELPKPSEQDSENKVPKAFEFGDIPTDQTLEHGNIQIHTFGVEQLIPLRKPDGKYKKKSETKTKKREEWIKNWVQRKFNKPKFPRVPLPPLAPASNLQFESTAQTTTVEPEEEPSIEPEIEYSEPNEPQHSLFAPTVPPKITVEISSQPKNLLEPTQQPKNRFNVDYEGIVREGNSPKS